MTPEESKILGISEEDISSFMDESMQLTPREIEEGIEEIILRAYEESPLFRQLVDQDAQKDPNRLGRSAKLVSKFLRHLQSTLQPERAVAIKRDTFGQAHEMIRDILHKEIQRPQEQQSQDQVTIPALTPDELKYFEIPGSKLTFDMLNERSSWDQVKDSVLFFLNKYKNAEGDRVKNELTKGIPKETAIDILSKFLNKIRQSKLSAQGGKLSPVDERWLGKSVDELQKISKYMVLKAEKKPESVSINKQDEINRKISEVLVRLKDLYDMYNLNSFDASIRKYTDIIDNSLPSVNLYEDRLHGIINELSRLGIRKSQFNNIFSIDPNRLTYSVILKDRIKEIEGKIREIKPETEGADQIRKGLELQLKNLKDISEKNLSGLTSAMDDYFDTLKRYQKDIKNNLSETELTGEGIEEGPIKALSIRDYKVLESFIKKLNDAALLFNQLSREQLFKGKWLGRGSMLVRKEAAGYSSKMEQYRGKGLTDTYLAIREIFDDKSMLPEIREKLLSVMEVSPDDTLNFTGEDYAGNPYGGSGLNVEESVKLINKLRTLVNKLNMKGKQGEALEVLSWAADLGQRIKGSQKKEAAFIRDMIRTAVMKNQDIPSKSPGDVPQADYGRYQGEGGSDRKYKQPGKAGWLIFRERLTKMGKKALENFFDLPNFVPQFINEMEKNGLNRALLTDEQKAKLPPVDVEKALEEVLQKVTGKEGDLSNILSTKIMQKYKAEKFDKKNLEKEVEGTRERIEKLNQSIADTESRYLPKLEEYGQFIEDPIKATEEQIKALRDKEDRDKKKDHKDHREYKAPSMKGEKVDALNFQKVLWDLSNRYITEETEVKEEPLPTPTPPRRIKHHYDEPYGKEAVEGGVPYSSTTRLTPSAFNKRYQVWKKELKDIFHAIDSTDEPFERAKKVKSYYSTQESILKRLSVYLKYQEAQISSDIQTLNNLDEFINANIDSDDEKIRKAAAKAQQVRQVINNEKKIFGEIKNSHRDIKSTMDTVRNQLDMVEKDLADKKVEMLYQVAVSPELHPDKETARHIKEQYKEHEKGLSYIIDRSRYKKNMNKIMTYHPRKTGIKWPEDKENPTLLGPERKKELEDKVHEMERQEQEFNKYIDYEHKSVALQKLKDDLEKMRNYKQVLSQNTESMKKLVKKSPWLEMLENYNSLQAERHGKLTKEDFDKIKKDLALLNSKVPEDFKNMEDMREKIELVDKAEQADTQRLDGFLKSMEDRIARDEKVLNEMRPGVVKEKTLPQNIQSLKSKLYQLKLQGKPTALRTMQPEERKKIVEERLRSLQEMQQMLNSEPYVNSQDATVQALKKDVADTLESTEYEIKNLGMNKQADTGEPKDDVSPIDKALEQKGIKPVPYMQEIKKPRGWEYVERFFNQIKREHRFLRDKKEKDEKFYLRTDYLESRLKELEQIAKTIDEYKNQPVNIGGDTVAFRDVMMKFEEELHKYQELISKYTRQKEDAKKRLDGLKQDLEYIDSLYDPETGEFQGLKPEEIENMKKVFLRMLYKELEGYWATKVGKNISVFGERDTEYYNKVFDAFRDTARARSNNKIIGLINKYKQETRSDFDDFANKLKSKVLEKRIAVLIKRYKEFSKDKVDALSAKREEIADQLRSLGKEVESNESIKKLDAKIQELQNPESNETIKDMKDQIIALKAKEEQLKHLYNEMAGVAQMQISLEAQKDILEQVKGMEDTAGIKISDKVGDKLDKKVEEKLNEVADDFEKEIDDLIDSADILGKVETTLSNGERALGITTPVYEEPREPKVEPVKEPSVEEEKTASVYTKDHPDFKLNILYGDYMQKKIAEFISV